MLSVSGSIQGPKMYQYQYGLWISSPVCLWFKYWYFLVSCHIFSIVRSLCTIQHRVVIRTSHLSHATTCAKACNAHTSCQQVDIFYVQSTLLQVFFIYICDIKKMHWYIGFLIVTVQNCGKSAKWDEKPHIRLLLIVMYDMLQVINSRAICTLISKRRDYEASLYIVWCLKKLR